MNYGDVEDELVTYLTPDFTTLEWGIASLPESQEVLNSALGVKPRVWVSYNGTDYDPTSGGAQMAHVTTVQLEFVVQARKLRGNNGAYKVCEYLRLKLLGKKLASGNLNTMYLVEERLIDYDDKDVWNYRIVFASKGREVQADSGAVDVLINSIIITVDPPPVTGINYDRV